ncbi:MAG: DUF541 domain-containing protein [Candidatus Nitrosothermus koennekii]|nr:MAG: DUF541 domain-containing protein [Candidatus Nitrosothermus koennekii]
MRIVIPIAIIAVVVSIIIASNLNTPNEQVKNVVAVNNTIGELSISGSASKSIEPDKLSISIGVTTNDKSAKVAVAENRELMNNVIKALNENGIGKDEMQTSYYSVYPIYSKSDRCIEIYPQTDCEVITGFRVVNTLTIITDATKDAGELIDLTIDAGATNIHGVNFFVSDDLMSNIKDQLLEEAVSNAKMRAEIALKPLDMKIVGVKSINIDSINVPLHALAERTTILPSEQKIEVNVHVTFYIS